MQNTEEISQRSGAGGMSSPPGGGMGGGLGQGGGMHGPAVRPHHPPSQSQAIVPAGPPHQQPDNVLSLQPIMSTPPPLSIGMPTTQVVRSVGSGGEQPLKRKRGRPRKYETGAASSPGVPGAGYPVLPALMPASSSPYTPGSEKRGRGRPPGSGKKAQLAALGVVLAGTGQGFTPHILTVNTGEDVATKIMLFAQHGPRAMCVLSANGAISNATLRQQSSSGGTVTYEGRYEILSLSGSFLPTDVGGGNRQRTGGLSVSLAGSDGRVIGGGVAGMLTAASPIQVVVGSFLSDTFKPQAKAESPLGSTPGGSSGTGSAPGSAPGGPRPPPPRPEPKPSPGSALGPHQTPPGPSPTGQVQRPQPMSIFQSMAHQSWQQSPTGLGDTRRTTDINISLPGG